VRLPGAAVADRDRVLSASEFQDQGLVKRRDHREIEAVGAFHRREPCLSNAALDHSPFTVDQFEWPSAANSGDDSFFDTGQHVVGAEHDLQPQHLDKFAFAALAHPGFYQATQRGKFVRQIQPTKGAAWSSAPIFCSSNGR
jgi:hypothetical protein